MSAAEGRAAGKVILLGEHAVVYGVPGIAAGIDKGARARATADAASTAVKLTLGGDTFSPEDGSDLGRALGALLAVHPAVGAGLEIHAEAELPPGGGLGCSAALAVAIARAVRGATGGAAEHADDAEILERALAWERVFHGNPSGIDTAAAAHATCLVFERGAGVRPLRARSDIWLAVGHSGAGASTKQMVEGLARLKERRPDVVGKFLDGVRSLVENATLAIQAGDALALGRFLDMNQMLLAGVMLSTERLEEMCRAARAAGALGAKLTGSGGGGCVIALGGVCAPGESGSEAEARAGRVVEAWRVDGFAAFTTRIAADGDAAARSAPSPSQELPR